MLTANKELQKGRYKIIRQIGREQNASLYEAFDNDLGRNILIEEISAELEADRQDLVSKAEFLTKIDFGRIVKAFDSFREDDHLYLSMEMIEGESLNEVFRGNKIPVAIADAVNWAEQLLESLEYLHNKTSEIPYFKLKPENLYLTTTSKIKFFPLGFGTSGNSESLSGKIGVDSSLNYSPLEIIWENLDSASQRVILNTYSEGSKQNLLRQSDVQSDIYGLGTTLYHLTTGKAPIDALERSINILDGNPDPLIAPHEIDRNIPLEISDILMKAVEIKREDRFRTPAKMQAELVNAFDKLKEIKAQQLKTQLANTPAPPVQNKKVSEAAFTPSTEPKIYEPKAKEKQELKPAEIKRSLVETVSVGKEAVTNVHKPPKPEFELDILELPEDSSLITEETISTVSEKQEIPTLEKPEIPHITQEESEEPEEMFVQEETIEQIKEEVKERFAQGNMLETVEAEETVESKDNVVAFVPKDSEEDWEVLFDQPVKENKTMKRMAAAAAVLVILGGGAWGIMNFATSNSMGANTTNSSQVQSPNKTDSTAEQTAENVSDSEIADENGETDQDIQTATTENERNGSEEKGIPNVNQIPDKKTVEKSKTSVAERVNEQNTAGSSSAESQQTAEKREQTARNDKKKKVTVDDLINDVPVKKKKVTVDDLINDN